jgi:hypothetical protein
MPRAYGEAKNIVFLNCLMRGASFYQQKKGTYEQNN